MAGVLAVNLTRTVLMIVTVSSAGVLIPVSGPVATWQSVWYRDLRPQTSDHRPQTSDQSSTRVRLVHSYSEMRSEVHKMQLKPALLCHKAVAKGTQSLLVRAWPPFRAWK